MSPIGALLLAGTWLLCLPLAARLRRFGFNAALLAGLAGTALLSGMPALQAQLSTMPRDERGAVALLIALPCAAPATALWWLRARRLRAEHGAAETRSEGWDGETPIPGPAATLPGRITAALTELRRGGDFVNLRTRDRDGVSARVSVRRNASGTLAIRIDATTAARLPALTVRLGLGIAPDRGWCGSERSSIAPSTLAALLGETLLPAEAWLDAGNCESRDQTVSERILTAIERDPVVELAARPEAPVVRLQGRRRLAAGGRR